MIRMLLADDDDLIRTALAALRASEEDLDGIVIVTGHGPYGHLERALAAGVRGFLPSA